MIPEHVGPEGAAVENGRCWKPAIQRDPVEAAGRDHVIWRPRLITLHRDRSAWWPLGGVGSDLRKRLTLSGTMPHKAR